MCWGSRKASLSEPALIAGTIIFMTRNIAAMDQAVLFRNLLRQKITGHATLASHAPATLVIEPRYFRNRCPDNDRAPVFAELKFLMQRKPAQSRASRTIYHDYFAEFFFKSVIDDAVSIPSRNQFNRWPSENAISPKINQNSKRRKRI